MTAKEMIIKKRGKCYDWYVMHYDVKAHKSLIPVTLYKYKKAKKLFDKAKPMCENDRIQLIFTPDEDDDTYLYDELMEYKTR